MQVSQLKTIIYISKKNYKPLLLKLQQFQFEGGSITFGPPPKKNWGLPKTKQKIVTSSQRKMLDPLQKKKNK